MSDVQVEAKPTRSELIDRLQWNSGGMGYGICAVASSMMSAMSRPKEPHGADDLKSVVAVSGPPDKYTDTELEKLVAFSDRQTANYDRLFRYRLGANLICINKFSEGSWMRKRMSWDMGPMFSDSLDEAIAIFEK